MKGLLIKDLKILAKQKKFFIFVLLLMVVMSFSMEDVSFSATYSVLIISMLTLTTISYDEMNGGMLFLLSLPANRKTYVKEKYVFAMLNLMFAAVLAFAFGYVASMVKQTDIAVADFAASVMIVLVAVGMALALAIPVDLKYGAEKGRMIVIGVLAGFLVIAVAVYKAISALFHIDVVAELTKVLARIESKALLATLLTGGPLVALLLVLYVSYLVSNRIMMKKEF
ncbi:MAG: ABC-2 transporter permease [Lachnospiraceae bacterium]|nr:ABC-2 transporter permease [Lachnospiraceae bacterium]